MGDLFLVRHGQASFGAADYDKLSERGKEQSRLLGRWLKRCGIVPDVVASGTMRRQAGTAELCMALSGGRARLGQPDDVAHAVVYLASDESRFVTASELKVDGGTAAA